jgi:citrate lyase subunit beta / citryl-CoA lyase
MTSFRSLIFVPAANPRFVDKAKHLNVDIVCFDLEDSVLPSEKVIARKMVQYVLRQRTDYKLTKKVYVRINSQQSGISQTDLRCAVRKGLDGIVVPKVNNKGELVKLIALIRELEGSRQIKKNSVKLMPTVETAEGVVNAYSIAAADQRIEAIIFGVYDFLYDMGLDHVEDDPAGYSYARMKIPVDARAAGVTAIDAIWQKVDDITGLRNDTAKAKRLGYAGKSIIHPNQIQPVHEVFKPSNSEIEWATKVVRALGPGIRNGKGKGALRVEGKMIDAVHYKQAKAILEIASQ